MWARELLIGAGCDRGRVESLTSHSFRTTFLAWLAKFGAKPSTRRILGYHSNSKDRMVLEYSRDALAGPLRELQHMLSMVSDGSFNPSATRSGYFVEIDADLARTEAAAEGSKLMTSPTRLYKGDIWASCQTSEGTVLPHSVVWIGKRWKDALPDSPWWPSLSKSEENFLTCYRDELLERPDAAAFILSVCGKSLACTCRDHQVCHADVIIELYKEAMAAVEGDDSEDSDAASSACAYSPRTRASRLKFLATQTRSLSSWKVRFLPKACLPMSRLELGIEDRTP